MGVDARMFVKLNEKPTTEQITRWSWNLVASIGGDPFWLDPERGQGALAWDEDANDPTCPHLDVNLAGRFYGVGYERGDILAHRAVAEWIEQNIPGAVVFYGGDHGDEFDKFDAATRARACAHLYGPHGRDYYMHDTRGTFATPPACALCVPGENRFDRNGWGKNYIRVSCMGCARSFVSRDNGESWAEPPRGE